MTNLIINRRSSILKTNSKTHKVTNLRQPPQAIEAEEALLSSSMLGAASEVLGFLKPEDLYDSRHQAILTAIAEVYAQGRQVDLLTVTEQLRSKSKIEQAGGVSFVARLVDSVPAMGSVEWLAGEVLEKKTRRRMIAAANRMAQAAYDNPDFETVQEQARKDLRDLDAPTAKGAIFSSYNDLAESEIERWEQAGKKATGVPTGLTKVDRLTGGFQPSDLVTLAARPGMGKTALMICMAENAARHGNPVAIFSLEMSKSQLYARQTAKTSQVDGQKFRLGSIAPYEWERIVEAQESLYKLPVFIDDTPRQHIVEIQRRARWAVDRLDIKLIVIDYLQLLRGDRQQRRRDLEIADITGTLKALAKELNLPVILLSQLNRQVENRDDKRPRLSDLRESGAIEQDSDIVAFIYRDEYYTQQDCKAPGVAELNIAKHRNGPTAMVRVAWIGWRCSFEDLPT
jgi:replicative DNA helicase